jgi:acetate kinase
MNILVINCGSSTLKFRLIETDSDAAAGRRRRLARGIVDRIGGQATLEFAAEASMGSYAGSGGRRPRPAA